MRLLGTLALFACMLLALSACKRERRDFQPDKVTRQSLVPFP